MVHVNGRGGVKGRRVEEDLTLHVRSYVLLLNDDGYYYYMINPSGDQSGFNACFTVN